MPRDTADLLHDIQDAATDIVEDTADATLDSFRVDRRMFNNGE